jgi:hypothetical protein
VPATAADLVRGFSPENALERAISLDPRLLGGLAWGKPREGHPEGAVAEHVSELFETLASWHEPEPRRSELRFVALVHDALKGEVKWWRPRYGSNHHAVRARRLAERYTRDERLLATIELHDRPYFLWKHMRKQGGLDEDAFEEMLARIPDHDFFLRFVELDGSPEGKDPEPIRWLRGELERRGLV